MDKIRPDDNLVVDLRSSSVQTFPFSLTNVYQDLPGDAIVNVKGCSACAFWLKITDGSAVTVRVLAAHEENPTNSDFYFLPVQSIGSDSVGLNSQVFEIRIDGTLNFLFSTGLFGLIKYLKVQVKGDSGTIDDLKISVNLT